MRTNTAFFGVYNACEVCVCVYGGGTMNFPYKERNHFHLCHMMLVLVHCAVILYCYLTKDVLVPLVFLVSSLTVYVMDYGAARTEESSAVY
jgi:hypothetical protein